jgi:hypothetical protein
MGSTVSLLAKNKDHVSEICDDESGCNPLKATTSTSWMSACLGAGNHFRVRTKLQKAYGFFNAIETWFITTVLARYDPWSCIHFSSTGTLDMHWVTIDSTDQDEG